MKKNKKEPQNTHEFLEIFVDDILKKVDNEVRFLLHSYCFASISDGQRGDKFAKELQERLREKLEGF